MKISNRTLLYLVLTLIVVFFLYFYSGIMIDSVIKGRMNISEWPDGKSFGWVPALLTVCLGVFIGWKLFKNKV